MTDTPVDPTAIDAEDVAQREREALAFLTAQRIAALEQQAIIARHGGGDAAPAEAQITEQREVLAGRASRAGKTAEEVLDPLRKQTLISFVREQRTNVARRRVLIEDAQARAADTVEEPALRNVNAQGQVGGPPQMTATELQQTITASEAMITEAEGLLNGDLAAVELPDPRTMRGPRGPRALG